MSKVKQLNWSRKDAENKGLNFITLWAKVARGKQHSSVFLRDWKEFLRWDHMKLRKRMFHRLRRNKRVCMKNYKKSWVKTVDKTVKKSKTYVGCQICKLGYMPFTAFNPFKKDQCNPDCVKIETETPVKPLPRPNCNPFTEIPEGKAIRNDCLKKYKFLPRTQKDQCIQICPEGSMLPPFMLNNNNAKCPTPNYCVMFQECEENEK